MPAPTRPHPPATGGSRSDAFDQDAFERKLYVIRRVSEQAVAASEDAGKGFYVTSSSSSSSSRTLNYKGMLIFHQLGAFYPDLCDERCKSALALVHSRFSTNTSPSWELAHPYRVICHNGEINTVMGNVNWMRARESQLASELFGEDLAKDPAGRHAGQLRLRDVRQRARCSPRAGSDRSRAPGRVQFLCSFVERFWGESH